MSCLARDRRPILATVGLALGRCAHIQKCCFHQFGHTCRHAPSYMQLIRHTYTWTFTLTVPPPVYPTSDHSNLSGPPSFGDDRGCVDECCTGELYVDLTTLAGRHQSSGGGIGRGWAALRGEVLLLPWGAPCAHETNARLLLAESATAMRKVGRETE